MHALLLEDMAVPTAKTPEKAITLCKLQAARFWSKAVFSRKVPSREVTRATFHCEMSRLNEVDLKP